MRSEGVIQAAEIFKEVCKIKVEKAIKIQRAYRCSKFKKGVKKYMKFLKKLKKKLKIYVSVSRLLKYKKYILKIQKWVRKYTE